MAALMYLYKIPTMDKKKDRWNKAERRCLMQTQLGATEIAITQLPLIDIGKIL